MPQMCCSPAPHDTQHADTVGSARCSGIQSTPASPGKGAPVTSAHLTLCLHTALFIVGYTVLNPCAQLQPIRRHAMSLKTGAAGWARTASTLCSGHSALVVLVGGSPLALHTLLL